MKNNTWGSWWVLPDSQLIDCKIQTPQFKNGKFWYFKKQSGTFDKNTMLFTRDSWLFGHNVQFSSIEEFKCSLLKIYERK